ncbi:MAG: hypothetical protein SGILL_010400 [Bacillariaceae sp.]
MRTSFSVLFSVLVAALLLSADQATAQRGPNRRAHRRGALATADDKPKRRSLGNSGKGSDTSAFDSYTEETTSSTQNEAVIASSSGVEGGGGTTKNATPWYIAAGALLAALAAGTAYWAVAKNRKKKREEEDALKNEKSSKRSRLLGSEAAPKQEKP